MTPCSLGSQVVLVLCRLRTFAQRWGLLSTKPHAAALFDLHFYNLSEEFTPILSLEHIFFTANSSILVCITSNHLRGNSLL